MNFLDAQVGVVAPDRERSVIDLEQVGPGGVRAGVVTPPGPTSQLAESGLSDLVAATMWQVLAGEAEPLPPSTLPSNQYYAPTLGQYLVNGLTRRVW